MNDSPDDAALEDAASMPTQRELIEESRLDAVDAVLKRKTARAEADAAAKLKAAAARADAGETSRQVQDAGPGEVDLLKAKLADQRGGPPVRPVGPPAPVRITEPASTSPAKPERPASSVATVAPRRRRATQPVTETCRIEWWRGYMTSEFHANCRDANGTGSLVRSSPSFRWRKSTPPPKDFATAAAAHGTLVAQLEGDGWIVKGRQGDWYSLELHRRPGAGPAGKPKGVA